MSSPPQRRTSSSTGAGVIHASAVVVSLTLSACTTGPPPITFDLSQPDTASRLLHPRRQLVVAEPSAVQPLDSNQVVVRRADGSLAALAHAAWADRLTKLIQARVVQAFENAGAVGHVGTAGGPITPDLTLDVEIRDFEIDIGAGQARVEIAARLVNALSGRTVAARILHASVPAIGDSPSTTDSLDQALGQMLGQLVRWAAPYI